MSPPTNKTLVLNIYHYMRPHSKQDFVGSQSPEEEKVLHTLSRGKNNPTEPKGKAKNQVTTNSTLLWYNGANLNYK